MSVVLCLVLSLFFLNFSIIALESHMKEDDTKWLTYWVTFAAFSLLEFFSEIILDFVPFYWLVKVS